LFHYSTALVDGPEGSFVRVPISLPAPGIAGGRGRMSPYIILLMILMAAFAASSNNIADDAEVIIMDDDDETVLVVRHRAASPLSPSSRTIRAEEFQGKFSDLASVLETVSGINIRTMGGHGQYAEGAIRGASAQGIRVYLDGVLLNSASAGAVDLSKIPLDRIRVIRVTKSTSGLRQMGAGMGGVIELFTDVDRRIISANLEAGSYGSIKGGMIIKSGSDKNIRQQFNADASSSNNNYPYIHDNGTTIPTLRDPDPTWDDTLMRKKNNQYRAADAAYGLSIDINDNHKITQQLRAGAFTQGLFVYHYKHNKSGSTGGRNAAYSIDYQGVITDKLTLSGEANAVYRYSNISDPDGRFYLSVAGKELESSGGSADIIADAKYSLTDNFYLAGLIGTRAEHYTQRNLAITDRPEMIRHEYRAGAEAGLTTGVVEAALRAAYKYEADTSTAGLGYWSPEGSRRTLSCPAAEAVARLNINPVTLQLSASTSKRSPTFFEKFGWGGGFISTPELKEETRMEADIGASIDMGEYTAAVSLFAGEINDKIKSIPRGGGFVKVMNFADTRFYGAEVDINTRLLRLLTVEISTSYLKSVISGAADPGWVNKAEPFVPELSGYIKTEADIKHLSIGHGVKYESDCFLGIDNREKRPAQTELSAWASYRIAEYLTVRYRADNYLNTANFDFLDNPKPRRTHAVSAALSF